MFWIFQGNLQEKLFNVDVNIDLQLLILTKTQDATSCTQFLNVEDDRLSCYILKIIFAIHTFTFPLDIYLI